MSCPVCEYAREHGSWPLDHRGTHCGLDKDGSDCHRSWTGMTESHCAVCHQHFSSDAVADKHEPYCSVDRTATAESMRAASQSDGKPLFDIRQRKHGPTWVRYDPRIHPFADLLEGGER